MFKKMLVGMAVGAMLTSQAFATTDTNKTIASIGAQGSQTYLTVTGGPTDTLCSYGVLYLPDFGTSNGKAIFGLALTLVSSGVNASRIDYSRDGSNRCTVSLIAM